MFYLVPNQVNENSHYFWLLRCLTVKLAVILSCHRTRLAKIEIAVIGQISPGELISVSMPKQVLSIKWRIIHWIVMLYLCLD